AVVHDGLALAGSYVSQLEILRDTVDGRAVQLVQPGAHLLAEGVERRDVMGRRERPAALHERAGLRLAAVLADGHVRQYSGNDGRELRDARSQAGKQCLDV